MKKLITFMLVGIIVSVSVTAGTASAQSIKSNYTLNTDIVAYVNGLPIRSYNIDGQTYVSVEDLPNHNIYISELKEDSSLTISLYYNPKFYSSKYIPRYIPKSFKGKIGEKMLPAEKSDISVSFNDYENKKLIPLTTFKVDGKVVVNLDELAQSTKRPCSWNEKERRIYYDAYSEYTYIMNNPLFDRSVNSLMDGFGFEFTNLLAGRSIYFQVTGVLIDGDAIDLVELTPRYIKFDVYQWIINGGDFFSELRLSANVAYSERINENTPERKEQLSKTYRVYMDGKLVPGELEVSAGNGHTGRQLNFDEPVDFKNVSTIRLEVGYESNFK